MRSLWRFCHVRRAQLLNWGPFRSGWTFRRAKRLLVAGLRLLFVYAPSRLPFTFVRIYVRTYMYVYAPLELLSAPEYVMSRHLPNGNFIYLYMNIFRTALVLRVRPQLFFAFGITNDERRAFGEYFMEGSDGFTFYDFAFNLM